MSNTKLQLDEMVDIVSMTGHAVAFEKECLIYSEDETFPEWDLVKAMEFLKEHNLPVTPEEYKAAIRFAFNPIYPKSLKITKGSHVILSADGILNTTAFVRDVGTEIIIIKALEDFEFDSSLGLTSGPDRNIVQALQPYLDNHLIEVIDNVSAIVFTPTQYLTTDHEEE